MYKGLVENVLPGMGAAFVDIGMRKCLLFWQMPSGCEKGDTVMVQVSKEAAGTKGRVTAKISFQDATWF